MTTIRTYFLQTRALFSNFRKRVGETSILSRLLVTRLSKKKLPTKNNIAPALDNLVTDDYR